MRVVFAHTDFHLYWPRRLKALHDFLASRGSQLHVVELTAKGSPYAFAGETAATHDIPWTCLFRETRMEDLDPAKAGAALSDCLERLSPDVVFAGALAFPSGVAALRWAARRRRRIVIFDSVRLEDVPRGRFVTHIKRRLYRNVDAAFTAAPGHERAFVAWGIRRDGVFYGQETVDNDWFADMARKTLLSGDQTRRNLALPELFFLGVGRLVEKKNWHSLIHAYAAFSQRDTTSKWRLVLVGDGPERASLQQLAAKLGTLDRVTFLPFASQEVLASIYALAGCLVLPSRYGETWGLVVNEAMACGLPVLVSDQCGCARTLVEAGGNGWTFSPDRTDEMTDLFARTAALSNTERRGMGNRSREIIAKWGLPRFCEGAWQAANFATASPLSPAAPLDRLAMS
jgi:glycosyltransferase involved in cell wall biosynthesis